MPNIHKDLSGYIATITLNNPEKRNALSRAMSEAIMAALEEFRALKARVVVLRAPRGATTWSAGHDVNELPKPGRDPLSYNDPLLNLIRAIQYSPMPVIALIEGGVWGGACDVAMSCDILVGCPTTTFTMTPARMSIPYNVSGILHFVNILGVNMVKEMLFTARPVSAEKALQVAILNHLVSEEEIEPFTYGLAAHITQNSPLSIASMKEQVRLLASAHPLTPIMFERIQGLRRQVYDSKDYEEGLRAFHEKRRPVFTGE
ncbi:MAG: methylmalonyl-CoA decarboxylase [Acidobacteria bacterium]|nr:methylmalonyl-CoA decarboxylase [Acidobacteriota bacterium]